MQYRKTKKEVFLTWWSGGEIGKDRFSKDVPLCYYEISFQLYCMSTVHEDLNLYMLI